MNRHILFLLVIGSFGSTCGMEISQVKEELDDIDNIKESGISQNIESLLHILQKKVHAHASLKEIEDAATPYKKNIGDSLIKFVAHYESHANVLEYMLQQGADSNEPGALPLFSAIRSRNSEGVRILLKHGANIVQESDNELFGSSTLMCAINQHFNEKNKTILTLLVEHKNGHKLINKKSETKTREQNTVLHVLADRLITPLPLDKLETRTHIRESIDILLEHGANPYLCDEHGENAMTIVTNAGLTDFAHHMKQKHKKFNDLRLNQILSAYTINP